MRPLQMCPNIYNRHVKQIDNLKENNFNEERFRKLRLRQNFEMSTFQFISTIFKKREKNNFHGLKYIGNTLFKHNDGLSMNCKIMMLEKYKILKVFQLKNPKFSFKFIKNLSYFYENFIYSPIPIILFSTETLESVRNFSDACFGRIDANNETIYVFENDSNHEIIIMDPYVAVNFGLSEYVIEILQNENINTMWLLCI